ncbi:prospero homeobox protein 2 [Pristis pectinata]|uniref:prospero homeobox protein 2 n=1 Tax=Pristis pectinata TaxID=685728 RepID=UPI00223E8064|nr:prospero homeobox protein 2 [Pristis pectinata]
MPEYHSSSLLSLKSEQRSFNSQVRTPFNHCVSRQSAEPSAYAMNLNVPEQDTSNSNNCYMEGNKTNQLHAHLKGNFFEDSVPSYSSRAIISQFLEKASKKKNSADHELIFSARNLSCSTADSFQEERNNNFSKDGGQDLGSSFSQHHTTNPGEGDRLFNEHLQAKRARVENIIRGMNSSPNANLPNSELERESGQRRGSLMSLYKENKRKQRLPQQQQQQEENPRRSPGLASSLKQLRREECHRLKQQLQEMQEKLLELQEKFFQVYDASESEHEDQEDTSDSSFHLGSTENGGNASERYHGNLSDMDQGLCVDYVQTISHEEELTTGKEANKHYDVNKKFNHCNHFGFSLVEGGYLAESLKYELTNAVAHIVDSAVQLFSVKPSTTSSQSLQSLPAARPKSTTQSENTNLRMTSHEFQCPQDSVMMHRYFDNCRDPCTFEVHDQTEAIPLVVRKSPQSQPNLVGPIIKQACQMPHNKPPLTLVLDSQMSLTELPEPILRYNVQNDMGHNFAVTAKDNVASKPTCLSWDTVKLRSKVTSHHTAHQSYPGFRQKPAENLGLSHIKSECGELQSMVEVTPYSLATIQEGLTPNHLKKAKLMFFYTRYPSSTTLKTYFSDVKFNRCITSQLIKWFSNFREFYYIQMEKFARQAVNDGITDATDLKVTRDSDLYRALNGHYNKANDFQIPKEFLEVAEVTLREFFNAVKSGKDSDPSWKKSIYKVISKLDTEVPEMFNSQGCLQDILYD